METEEQQVEELKKWWKENGSAIVTGVVLGLAILFGTRAWFSWQEGKAQQASVVYNLMMQMAEQGDSKTATDNADRLIADYSGTPYASLASLLLARFRTEEGNLDAARAQLQWVVD
ncbi:MAG: tetratricopeptide repeat protein, partial [Thiohalobacterales bacterium]|nr:tetratricopeptide repeat protein [Thiohalobacterales bacterium]